MAHSDMALNHGTYCSARCADVLDRYRSRTGLRMYPAADNGDLRRALAENAGVSAEHVLVGNGSGPLLKTVIPFLVEREIRGSLLRTARYLLRRKAFPLITTRLTYSKVPAAAVRVGLQCELLPLGPENHFTLDRADLERRLSQRAGLVYLCNPNNPTGNQLLTRPVLEELLGRYRDSWFFIDEAYVHYLDADPRFAELVLLHPNLVIMRSFSFAYGLGAARIGYAITAPEVVRTLEAKLTPHRVGQLAADLAMASLGDPEHLPSVRRETALERSRLLTALGTHSALEAFPSQTNFILCRTRAPWSGPKVHEALLARGIKVKIFEPFGAERYDDYFRITVGLPEENSALIAAFASVLAETERRVMVTPSSAVAMSR